MKRILTFKLFETVSYEYYIEDVWPKNTNKPQSVDYKFTDGQNNFIVQFRLNDGVYSRDYIINNNNNPYGIVNSSPFRIIGTVTKITVDFIKKYNPKVINIYHIKNVGENRDEHSIRGLLNKRLLEIEIPKCCPNYSYKMKKVVLKDPSRPKVPSTVESISIIRRKD